MALIKNVDGKVVELTAEEETAVRAEWAAADAAQEAQRKAPRPLSVAERLAALETQVAALTAASAKQ